MRINSSISTGFNSTTFTSTTAGQSSVPTGVIQPHPMAVLLFGKKPPRLVDKKKHPKLKRGLSRLGIIKDEVTELLGLPAEAFSIELCEGANACISREGQIAVGTELLEEHQDDDDFLIAMLGHEIGHQPDTWPNNDLSHLTKSELRKIYREEEAKADRFAGKVLAELGANPDSICRFLLENTGLEKPESADYYPPEVRAKMIREAYYRRHRVVSQKICLGFETDSNSRTRNLR